MVAEIDTLKIGENYAEKYGFHDESTYADNAVRGLTPRARPARRAGSAPRRR